MYLNTGPSLVLGPKKGFPRECSHEKTRRIWNPGMNVGSFLGSLENVTDL